MDRPIDLFLCFVVSLHDSNKDVEGSDGRIWLLQLLQRWPINSMVRDHWPLASVFRNYLSGHHFIFGIVDRFGPTASSRTMVGSFHLAALELCPRNPHAWRLTAGGTI